MPLTHPICHCWTFSSAEIPRALIVIYALEGYLEPQDAFFFREGIAMLEHQWVKCIEVRGNYIKK